MDKTVLEIQRRMVAAGLTLATAESCTGGGIAKEITRVSGSSNYYQGGLVAYQNYIKEEFLGVSAEDISRYDVVSEPVVRQMVRGACKMFGTDYAIASTGYADKGSNLMEYLRAPSGLHGGNKIISAQNVLPKTLTGKQTHGMQ